MIAPLQAVLGLDVWECTIRSSTEVLLVLSEFDLQMKAIWNADIDRGLQFRITFNEDSAHYCPTRANACTYDVLGFTIYWGYSQQLSIKTDTLNISCSRNLRAIISQMQDVLNAILQSPLPLEASEALDWMLEVSHQMKQMVKDHAH